ncbi:MAG TPA: ester cyclase [Nitrososphaeraceae archaeon]|jgi:SnoaL-like polyketide cyclase|nr:ester cyclase [Nitrososphaeraceae archaeon]
MWPKKYKEIVSAVIDGMPDPQITDYDTIAKSDKVMIRWTMTGTPKRTFWHISKQ